MKGYGLLNTEGKRNIRKIRSSNLCQNNFAMHCDLLYAVESNPWSMGAGGVYELQ